MEKVFGVYMMAHGHNTVIYTGMTGDLKGRVWQHKSGVVNGFTKRCRLTKLVYFEACPGAEAAILREKQIKGGSRKRKLELICRQNPTWRDLSVDL